MLLSRAAEIVLKLLNLPPFKGYRLMSGDTLNRISEGEMGNTLMGKAILFVYPTGISASLTGAKV